MIFMFSFAGLAVSLYPGLLPPSVMIADAAASPRTLVSVLTGIGMLLPVMMIYNGYQYLVFRGKVEDSSYGREYVRSYDAPVSTASRPACILIENKTAH